MNTVSGEKKKKREEKGRKEKGKEVEERVGGRNGRRRGGKGFLLEVKRMEKKESM